ncbi:uncharacterized protein PAC_11213 [Phialocephala subalpina]|uniref:FAD-binding PCMH-type domain-containing protein n=1 Tax=Phialocephala subalpina TaxID=576137 RepID=A0A1L7X8K8_9HELO|nr:uncharacterized protein PAC_11213 [Phialocephala subalpina]
MLKADCVVLPETIDQVQKIVRLAKANNIPITFKNGGHGYQGSSTADGGILLDLFRMNKAKLDMNEEVVTIDGGALWGTVYKQLSKDKIDGYIINGGRCNTVGVSGFILGGGLGPFTRSFGMGSDTLLEATIITADGNRVTAKATDDPESGKGKLFWALCGAGGGNFGVVVELKLKVQKLSNQEKKVVAGRFMWYPEPEDDLLGTMDRFYTTNWTNQMTLDSSWWKEEIVKAYPDNRSFSLYASFVFGNDSATIEAGTAIVNEELRAFRKNFKGEQVLAQVTFIHSGGQATAKHSSETAFPWHDAIEPFSIMRRAAFINFPDSAIRPDAHERAYFGGNRERLQEVKRIWDKDGFFEWAQGVKLLNTNQPTLEDLPTISTDPDEAYISDEDQFSAEESEESDSDTLVERRVQREWDNYTPSQGDDFEGMFDLPWWAQP